MKDPQERDSIEAQLRGNTFRLYWHLLQQGDSVGVREVQRALSMSSPSVASHHLSKLVDLDLVERKTDGTYELKKIVKVGVLKDFVNYRGSLLPRFFFVAVFFTSVTLAYVLFCSFVWPGLFDRMIALSLGVAGGILSWLETWRLWKLRVD